jgi:hypothetical protein
MLHGAYVRVNAVIARTLPTDLCAFAEMNLLRPNLILLFEDHLMKLVPVVEIV